MKKTLFFACIVLAILGCGGDMGELPPCLDCDFCGSQRFDSSTQSCCGNEIYSRETQFCSEGSVFLKCGSGYNNTYNTSTHFCSGNLVYSKCSGSDYATSTQYCSNGTVKAYSGAINYAGQTYKTQVIGNQTWFAENLNYNASGSKCYENEPNNCTKYGRLYDWSTAMDLPSSCNSTHCSSQIGSPHRGVCPAGWHLPSRAEWEVMTAYIGGASTEGKKLKATSGWNSNGNGTDQYGFSALPGGGNYSNGSVYGYGAGYGLWWSASEGNSDYAYSRIIYHSDENALWTNVHKSVLFSVRCLQDAPVFACTMTATTGTMGVPISPAPAVTCNGTAVTDGLTWTPAGLIPTTSGNVAVSVSASSGVCAGMTATCYGSVYYEGQTYKTVVIGTQAWMAENLDYAVEGSKCYKNEQSNCDKYGRLYNWATAMNIPSSCNSTSCSSQIGSIHRGICPSGWHIPSYNDWNTLKNFVESDSGCSSCDARLLKATSGWSNNGNGTDAYSFSALPGGRGSSVGSFDSVGNGGNWWSARDHEIISDNASSWDISYYYEYARWYGYGKSYLFSVRCLQD